MQTTVEHVPGSPAVTVLGLEGELDASNFEGLIGEARRLYEGGSRRLLVDLTGLSYMSSSGLVALHSIALIYRGQEPPDPEAGWGAIHSLGVDVSGGAKVGEVKLAGPQAPVDRVLERTGLKQFFEVHPDLAAGLGSF
jgi:anti-anti-sigma regulatory factor